VDFILYTSDGDLLPETLALASTTNMHICKSANAMQAAREASAGPLVYHHHIIISLRSVVVRFIPFVVGDKVS